MGNNHADMTNTSGEYHDSGDECFWDGSGYVLYFPDVFLNKRLSEVVMSIRKRKGLREQIPIPMVNLVFVCRRGLLQRLALSQLNLRFALRLGSSPLACLREGGGKRPLPQHTRRKKGGKKRRRMYSKASPWGVRLRGREGGVLPGNR
jgi:hypothetical protein